MISLKYTLALLVAALCLPLSLTAQPQAGVPPIVADDILLFGDGFEVLNSGMKGGQARQDPETRRLQLTMPKEESGGSARVIQGGTRLDLVPLLGDRAPRLELIFRPGSAEQALPEGLYLVLETLDRSVSPSTKKRVRTETLATSTAEKLPDGWLRLRFAFEELSPAKKEGGGAVIHLAEGKFPDIEGSDTLERVQFLGTTAGALEVSRVSFVRMRNVSVSLRNPYGENAKKLEIAGETSEPDAKVTLRLTDAGGKAHSQSVQAQGGKFQFTWENPPVTVGKANTLSASLPGAGTDPLNQAVPQKVFGYLTDTGHVWLRAKGRDIVTSPLSEGGERPFYSVGVGYGKNVLVRGYDDETLKYCKTMGLNTVRLAFYTTHFNNKKDRPLTFKDITDHIDPVVESAKRHGMYVILDDHSYFKNEIVEETARGEQSAGGWTEERFENWIKRWVQVAEHYKDEPYILAYELCNEPVCEPETARKWYKRCIDAVRKVDQRHIVMVGTNHWSHARAMKTTWDGIANTVDAPYNNVVFSFHDYPLDDNPWVVQKHLREFQAQYNVPVMCTEFGGGGKPERIHREAQAGMLAMFAHDRVGWMIWALYYEPEKSTGFPTRGIQNKEQKTWEIVEEKPGYYIPYPELWAPTARIMGTPFPVPAAH